MSDLIERQAAIDAVKKNTFRLTFAEEQNCEGHVAWSANAIYSDVIEGALLELPSAQSEPHYDEWCTDCKEYNQERHCCPRWNRVIRETLKDAQPNTDHIYAELSKVYNVKGLPDEAIGIIGDLMLSLDGPSAQPEPLKITIDHEPTADELERIKHAMRNTPVMLLPSAQPEKLTDKEQRIFLSAMGREEEVCKEVDDAWRDSREPYEDSLVYVCKEIKRKVKGALWT